MPTRDAVAHGIGATGGVVTSAAAVMVAVFAIFATLSMVELKQFGVGLAVAVAIDATVIRVVLLPATMTMLGEANWYLPRFLQRLFERRPASAVGAATSPSAYAGAGPARDQPRAAGCVPAPEQRPQQQLA